jgi:hypothetical protein
MKKYYAGVGSRKTPLDICLLMSDIAFYLEQKNWTLRSGHAYGADISFESGIVRPSDTCEIFKADDATDNALENAKLYHPNWAGCDNNVRKLHARNSMIILGKDLDSPVDFVVCWTEGGLEKGGTGQSLRVAKANNIRIFNLFDEKVKQYFVDKLTK